MNMRSSNWSQEMRLNNRWATQFSYGKAHCFVNDDFNFRFEKAKIFILCARLSVVLGAFLIHLCNSTVMECQIVTGHHMPLDSRQSVLHWLQHLQLPSEVPGQRKESTCMYRWMSGLKKPSNPVVILFPHAYWTLYHSDWYPDSPW